jgi:glutamate-ammonia-ligase adenylyltransferase
LKNSQDKFHFSEDFIKGIINLTGGYFSSNVFDKILNELELESNRRFYFTRSSESNLFRIISASFDKISLLSDLLKYPHQVEILIAVSANSNYLTDVIVRNPEYLYLIFNDEFIKQKIEIEKYDSELYGKIEKFKSYKAKLNIIRSHKRIHLLRIGINDILNNSSVFETTQQLSFLAKSILTVLFDISFDEILLKYKIKTGKNRYCLCALGKLGGDEVNYSSDVDLILFYDKNSIEEGTVKKEFFELLSETAQLFTKSATDLTENGFIYRIDFRLRPDGKQSPLCRTMADYLRYYETRGEDWERQMLLKLSLVCGNKNLYKQFTAYLDHFIYPKSFLKSPVEQIKHLRKNVEENLGEKLNIKLKPGGIRDIEFSVQALQLLNGGKIKELQTGNTLTAIKKLTNHNLLNEEESELFEQAYNEYRNIEHYLQLMNNTQTHDIPSEGELLDKLASFLNYENSETFLQNINEKRNSVRDIYKNIMNIDEINSTTDYESLKEAGFANIDKAEKSFEFLRTGKGVLQQKEFSINTINTFSEIENVIFKHLKKFSNPDKVLDNYVKVVSSSKFAGIWYNEFKDENFHKDFLSICSFAQVAVDQIAVSGIATDLLLTKKVFDKLTPEDFQKLSFNDLKLTLSILFSLKLIDHSTVSGEISRFITLKCVEVLNNLNITDNYFVAALGSFGAAEMSFSSDTDLIVVAENIEKNPEIHNIFQKFVDRIIKLLPATEVDFRLRPEGKNSPLVTDIKGYESYIKNRMEIWELASLHKIKFVHGSKELFVKFRTLLEEKIKNTDNAGIKNIVLDMYNKVRKQFSSPHGRVFNIKKSYGGLINIEFLIQLWILSDYKFFNKTTGLPKKDFWEDLKTLRKEGETLQHNYDFLKTLELANQNIFNSSGSKLPNDKNKLSEISAWLEFSSVNDFENKLQSVKNSNIKIFKKYFD